MNDRLSFTPRNENGAIVLTLAGELDVYTLAKLKEAIALLLEKPLRGVILDLSQVAYVDSSSIGYFIKLEGQTKGKMFRFGIAAPSPEVRRIFELTHVTRVLTIFETVDLALGSMLPPPEIPRL